MRIVSWNCNGAFRRKFRHVEDLDPDLVIIQECENPARYLAAFEDWACNYLWSGNNQNRGIGIFSRSGSVLSRLPWDDGGYSEFLPVRVDDALTLLGVWAKAAGGSAERYVGQVCNYLLLHGDKLDQHTIVCGDFNSNVIWDKPRKTWNHATLVDQFAGRDFVSVYHATSEESQGEERTPTFYLHRKPNRPYRIDYVFLHESRTPPEAAHLKIGDPQQWLEYSDHMPMIVDI